MPLHPIGGNSLNTNTPITIGGNVGGGLSIPCVMTPDGLLVPDIPITIKFKNSNLNPANQTVLSTAEANKRIILMQASISIVTATTMVLEQTDGVDIIGIATTISQQFIYDFSPFGLMLSADNLGVQVNNAGGVGSVVNCHIAGWKYNTSTDTFESL